jgi:ADP-ribosyl-[dinitrogen reductase] hydrolase
MKIYLQYLDKPWLQLQFHDNDQQQIIKPDQFNIDENSFPPEINDQQLLNRIQGSIFGMTIGDALGAHVEFRPQSYLKENPVKDLQGGGTWGLEKGQVTLAFSFN